MRGRRWTRCTAPEVEDKTANNAQLGEQRGENGGVGRTGESTVARAGEDSRKLSGAVGRGIRGGRAFSGVSAGVLEDKEGVELRSMPHGYVVSLISE